MPLDELIAAFEAANENVHLADEQKIAIRTICNGSNIFLTGPAGSGKTFALMVAITLLQDQGKCVRIAAPTGKAAQGIGGVTLHSLFGLTPKKMEKRIDQLEAMVEGNDNLRQRLAQINVLVIEEISMVENIFFSRLNRMMQAAKENNEPFGGIQLIVCGDFRQLPPVKPFSYCFTCGKPTEKERSRERRTTIRRCPRCLDERDERHQWAFFSEAWDFCDFVNIYCKRTIVKMRPTSSTPSTELDVEKRCDQQIVNCFSITKTMLGVPPTSIQRTLKSNK